MNPCCNMTGSMEVQLSNSSIIRLPRSENKEATNEFWTWSKAMQCSKKLKMDPTGGRILQPNNKTITRKTVTKDAETGWERNEPEDQAASPWDEARLPKPHHRSRLRFWPFLHWRTFAPPSSEAVSWTKAFQELLVCTRNAHSWRNRHQWLRSYYCWWTEADSYSYLSLCPLSNHSDLKTMTSTNHQYRWNLDVVASTRQQKPRTLCGSWDKEKKKKPWWPFDKKDSTKTLAKQATGLRL